MSDEGIRLPAPRRRGLLRTVGDAFRGLKAAANVFAMQFPRRSVMRWLLPRTRFDYARETGEGLGSSVVMPTVLWLARNFPEAPLILRDRDEDTIRDHDMLSLIRRPNAYYSGRVLVMGTAISLAVNGNGYWLKAYNRQRKPVELWYTPHWLMDPKYPDDGSEFISHYAYRPGGVERIVPRENVVHFRNGIDPEDPRKGLAPLAAQLREIFTDDEAANFSAALLRNSGVPGILAAPDWGVAGAGSAISETDAQDVKAYFKAALTGDKRGEPLVMTAPTKVEQFGFNPRQLELGILRRIPEERITAALGIPAAVVGLGSGLAQTKVGATMRELREMAYENGVIPLQALFADDIWLQLLGDFEERPEDWEVAFDLSRVRVLQEDENKLAERMDRLVRGRQITIAEARRQMGFETDDSHDVYLQGYAYQVVPAKQTLEEAVATTVLPSGAAQEAETETPAEVTPENAAEEAAKAARIIADGWEQGLQILRSLGPPEGGNGHKRSRLKAAPSAEARERLIAALYRDEIRLADRFAGELATRFRAYGERAAELYLELTESGQIPDVLAAKAAGDVEVKAEPDPVEFNMAVDKIIAALDEEYPRERVLAYRPYYQQVAHATIDTLEAVLELGVNQPDVVEARVFAAGGKRMGLVDLTEQAKESMFETIRETRELGEGPRQLALRIKDEVPRGPWKTERIRGDVIGRTETKYAQNYSSLRAYEQVEGVTAVQVWDAQRGPTDEYCEMMNGQVVSFADAQVLADTEHPNGTRSFGPVYGEAEVEPIFTEEQLVARGEA